MNKKNTIKDYYNYWFFDKPLPKPFKKHRTLYNKLFYVKGCDVSYFFFNVIMAILYVPLAISILALLRFLFN